MACSPRVDRQWKGISVVGASSRDSSTIAVEVIIADAKRSLYRKARFALAGFVAIGVVCVTVFYIPRLLAIRALVSRGASYHVEFPGERMLRSWSAWQGGKPLDVSAVWHRCGLWVVPFSSVKDISFSSINGSTDQDIQLLAPFFELEYV